jgi:putative ABC transport system permease protein
MRSLLDGDGRPLPLDQGGVLGAALEERLGLHVGDSVVAHAAPVAGASGGDAVAATVLRVAGFVDEPFGTYAYADLSTAATAAGLSSTDPPVTVALVRYAPDVDRDAMRARLSELPGVAAIVDSRALYDTAQSFMGLFYAFVGVMLVLGGVMAFALVFNTMSANVAERATELAALRTMGMAPATIGRLLAAENLVLTLIALVPGLLVAAILAAAFMASFSSDLFRFDLAVRPTTFLGTAAVIIAVAILSQVPSLRAASGLDLARVVREHAT